VTLRARWVTLRARWVTLRARWVTLRARWVTLRARWVTVRHAGKAARGTAFGVGALEEADADVYAGDRGKVPCPPTPLVLMKMRNQRFVFFSTTERAKVRGLVSVSGC
jgi:hypothetical protein